MCFLANVRDDSEHQDPIGLHSSVLMLPAIRGLRGLVLATGEREAASTRALVTSYCISFCLLLISASSSRAATAIILPMFGSIVGLMILVCVDLSVMGVQVRVGHGLF